MALNMLQRVRDEYGLPMTVTSGGRCALHRNEKHRSVPADHQKGLGIDIRITGLVMGTKLAVIAGKCGFNACVSSDRQQGVVADCAQPDR